MHMIRKGQVRWLAKSDIAEQVRFVDTSSRSVHDRPMQARRASRLPAPICNRTTMAAHAATPGHENERYSDSAGGEVFKGHWWLRPATEPDPAGVQVPPTGCYSSPWNSFLLETPAPPARR